MSHVQTNVLSGKPWPDGMAYGGAIHPAATATVQLIPNAPEASAAVDSLDLSVVDRWRRLAAETDAQLVGQLCESFRDDTARRLVDLREAADSADPERLRQVAHAVKGASANLGAVRMAALSRRLEALGEQRCVEGALPLIEELEQEFTKAGVLLTARLQGEGVPCGS
jgi:two-component system, sensor histidine kinase and response regulator